jgi:hypothetical protein
VQEFITLDKPALLTDVGVGVWEKIVSGEVRVDSIIRVDIFIFFVLRGICAITV